MEAAYSQPLLQHMGEPAEAPAFGTEAGLPGGALLRLPEAFDPHASVCTLHLKPSRNAQALTIRLYNAGTQEQVAHVGSGLLRITSAHWCDLMENPLAPIQVTDGALEVILPPGRVNTLSVSLALA